jgi:multiple sugar transport system ATP-binding protein
MAAKLELRGVSKRFGEHQAVRNLSLALGHGEFLSLLGPSGCGKSTTLAMIAGFVAPDAGDIVIDGVTINGLSPQRRHIGLVLQDYAVFTSLTVRANLAFGLEVKRQRRGERRRRVDEIARRLDVADLLDRRGGSLSMSEMQRVALARTLATEPQFLLLDEPMSNLDADVRARLRGELRQLQKSLTQTVLYVTHDQAEALSMSDRVAVMRDGEIVQVATPEDIYRQPADRFVAEFIGDPPLNVIPCEITAVAEALIISLPGAVLKLSSIETVSGAHWLGVRPHDIELVEKGTPGAMPAVLRFVENFGASHVLHAEFADDALLRVEAAPCPRSIGETLHLRFRAERLLVMERITGRVISLPRLEAAA